MSDQISGTAPDRDDAVDAATDPAEDQKAKFREALERKSKASHRSASGSGTSSSGAHGESAAAGGKRQFCRKSGG